MPEDTGMAYINELVCDGTVWHRPAYAATMYGELGRGSCAFACGQRAVVRGVAASNEDPRVDALCVDCAMHASYASEPLAVGYADIYQALGNGSRWRTATGIARDLTRLRHPPASTVARVRVLLEGLHEVGLASCDDTTGPPQFKRHP